MSTSLYNTVVNVQNRRPLTRPYDPSLDSTWDPSAPIQTPARECVALCKLLDYRLREACVKTCADAATRPDSKF
jgi:hypothetical protein